MIDLLNALSVPVSQSHCLAEKLFWIPLIKLLDATFNAVLCQVKPGTALHLDPH